SHMKLRLSRRDRACGSRQQTRPAQLKLRARKVKQMKSISAVICALVLLGSMAVMGAEQTCCEKAKAEGKECTHKCCVKAKKEGKVCEKCNPPKDKEKK